MLFAHWLYLIAGFAELFEKQPDNDERLNVHMRGNKEILKSESFKRLVHPSRTASLSQSLRQRSKGDNILEESAECSPVPRRKLVADSWRTSSASMSLAGAFFDTQLEDLLESSAD